MDLGKGLAVPRDPPQLAAEVDDSSPRSLCMATAPFSISWLTETCFLPRSLRFCPLRSAQPCPLAVCDSGAGVGLISQMAWALARGSFKQAKQRSGRSTAIRQEDSPEIAGSPGTIRHVRVAHGYSVQTIHYTRSPRCSAPHPRVSLSACQFLKVTVMRL